MTIWTKLECLQSEFSDFYKEVHGFRPRWMTDEQWDSEEWLEAAIEDLVEESKQEAEREAEWRATNVVRFEQRVQEMIEYGAKDRATALRWIIDGENDIDYVEYTNGLPYGYLKEAA